ncbi:MAG: hypothetical protein ACK4E0_06380 [Chitinophagaceae bacterium]
MWSEKEYFLRNRFVPLLQRMNPNTAPRWGKMSVQQMIEHLAFDSVPNANGRLRFEKPVTPPELLPKYREFMLSDKPFRENTKNPLMAEEPHPLRFKTVQAAIGALQMELNYFFEVYKKDPGMRILNPFFGELNFDENVHLLHKHSLHHLRQYGIVPEQYERA